MPIGHTLTLDLNEWDFMLDSGGNIATSVGLYPWYGADTCLLYTSDAADDRR